MVFLMISHIITSSHAQSKSEGELAPGYYITVAAYAEGQEFYATRFTNHLIKKGHDARYGFNRPKNLYFVYLNYFSTLREGISDMLATREKGEFIDAWVRVVSGDIVATNPKPIAGKEEKKEESITATGVDPSSPVSSVDPIESEDPPVAEEEPFVEAEEEGIVQYDTMTLGNTEVFLSLFNATNNRIVDGVVHVFDTDRARLITDVSGNEYLILPDPKSKSGKVTLIGEVFGYRKVQHEITYPLPLQDTVENFVELMGTTLVVTFPMIRYHKGDIATLYNVYFYNDAAIMMPESKPELNALLQMMQENPNYRIKLHGHTNGNYHGTIISRAPEGDFFTMGDDVKKSMGTSKKLSTERAEIIKEYLIANGVAASRIEVKAWGGKRAIHDKNGPNARKNVRVEVEVLQE